MSISAIQKFVTLGADSTVAAALVSAGYRTPAAVRDADAQDLEDDSGLTSEQISTVQALFARQ